MNYDGCLCWAQLALYLALLFCFFLHYGILTLGFGFWCVADYHTRYVCVVAEKSICSLCGGGRSINRHTILNSPTLSIALLVIRGKYILSKFC